MSRWIWTAAVAALAFGAGCGGGDTGPSELPNGSMSAKIDGSSWTAIAITAAYSNNLLVIGASDANSRGLGFAAIAPGPGTYAIGTSVGANGNLTIAGQGWLATSGSGSGSITVTSVSASAAEGTFQFTMAPVSGTGATGNKVITEGKFKVTY
ncbi:MAG: DUF6252 family protein [Gemmatimonadales bacterium]